MATDLASSGTLIAAALETVGYHYQSHILDALMGHPDGPWNNALHILASFVYIVCAIVALTQYVLTSRYKFALWFLIGPTCFYFVTVVRQESSGTAWMFGDEARNEEMKEGAVRDSLGFAGTSEDLPLPRVSWVFHGFNKMISGASRGLVNSIMNGRKEADLRFMVRAPLYGAMVTSVIDDKNFKELLHVALLRDCRKLYQSAMRVDDATLSDADRAAARAILDDTHFHVKYSEGAATYVSHIMV